jgi:hypothetical protein
MPRLVVVVLLALSASGLACNQRGPTVQPPGVPAPPAVRYGANSEAGGTFTPSRLWHTVTTPPERINRLTSGTVDV